MATEDEEKIELISSLVTPTVESLPLIENNRLENSHRNTHYVLHERRHKMDYV